MLLGALVVLASALLAACGSGGSSTTFSVGSQVYHASTDDPLTSTNGIAFIRHAIEDASGGRLVVSQSGAGCLAGKYSDAGVHTIGQFLDPKTTKTFLRYARECRGS